jgi:predicted homoserine dehydrogenase-like protein
VNLQYQAKGRAHRLLLDSMPREPLYIGIIGGGRMGCHIANALLTYGGIRPEEIIISTRRPETLSKNCFYPNVTCSSIAKLGSCHQK